MRKAAVVERDEIAASDGKRRRRTDVSILFYSVRLHWALLPQIESPSTMQHRQGGRVVILPSKVQCGLSLLLEAAKYAIQTRCDRWEFAVEIDQLHRMGLSNNDLRLLSRLRLIDHANEITNSTNSGRQFKTTNNLCFTRRTCFVLSSAGLAAAIGCMSIPRLHHKMRAICNANAQASAPVLPHWDVARHLLSFKDKVVKRFVGPAGNQELILSAFHEEGWPARIDDPLSQSPEIDAKRRLNDAIRCLNRKQINNLIHFRGDGTGEGVLWEAGSTNAPPLRRENAG